MTQLFSVARIVAVSSIKIAGVGNLDVGPFTSGSPISEVFMSCDMNTGGYVSIGPALVPLKRRMYGRIGGLL